MKIAGSLARPAADPAALRGNLLGFNHLVAQHQTRLYTLACRVLADPQAAAAVTQTALERAFANLRHYREGPFEVWVLRWLVEACRAHEQAHGPARLNRGPASPAASDALLRSLAALPLEQRLAVALVDLAGLDYAQAGTALGTPPAQVQHTLALARRCLLWPPG